MDPRVRVTVGGLPDAPNSAECNDKVTRKHKVTSQHSGQTDGNAPAKRARVSERAASRAESVMVSQSGDIEDDGYGVSVVVLTQVLPWIRFVSEKPDGTCLFRAVARQVKGRPEAYNEVKKDMQEFVSDRGLEGILPRIGEKDRVDLFKMNIGDMIKVLKKDTENDVLKRYKR